MARSRRSRRTNVRFPEGRPAVGGGRRPGIPPFIGGPNKKYPPISTPPSGPPKPPPKPPGGRGSNPVGPPSSPTPGWLAEINRIFGPQEKWFQDAINRERSQSLQLAESQQRLMAEYAKWYMQNIPSSISGIYGGAAETQGYLAKGFSDGMQIAQDQAAANANSIMGLAGSPEAALQHPTTDAANVLYGTGGFLPGMSLSTQGAAYAGAAALGGPAIIAEGGRTAAKTLKEASDRIFELEGKQAELTGRKAEAEVTAREKSRAALDDRATDLYNNGLISQREFARRMGIKDWRRYPKTLKPGESAGIDASASKLVGYLVDDNGNPIRDRRGKPILILQDPKDVELPKVDTTLSAAKGYYVDDYGQPILDRNGNTQPYVPYRAPSAGGKGGGKGRFYWGQGAGGAWYRIDRTGVLPPQLDPNASTSSFDENAMAKASDAARIARYGVPNPQTPAQKAAGISAGYKTPRIKNWEDAVNYVMKQDEDVTRQMAEYALWKFRRKLKGAPKKAPPNPKASAALSGGGQLGYLASLWVQAGGDPKVANIAAAIAMGESSGNANANLVTSREDSRGLWQINTRAHPWSKKMNLYDPLANAKAAVRVWKNNGKTFNPWTVYTSGAYKTHLTNNVSYTSKGFAAPLPGRGQAGSWGYADPEGQDGRHMAIDWFAGAGTGVAAPEDGVVIEARYDPRASGQVFGGTVKVRTRDGKVWVFRHTNPAAGITVGMRVPRGTTVGAVAPWTGRTHSHVELWRTEGGGYHARNMLNPLVYLYGSRSV